MIVARQLDVPGNAWITLWMRTLRGSFCDRDGFATFLVGLGGIRRDCGLFPREYAWFKRVDGGREVKPWKGATEDDTTRVVTRLIANWSLGSFMPFLPSYCGCYNMDVNRGLAIGQGRRIYNPEISERKFKSI